MHAVRLEDTAVGKAEGVKGLYKIFVAKGTDAIIGANFVGGPACELIGVIALAMKNRIGLSRIS